MLTLSPEGGDPQCPGLPACGAFSSYGGAGSDPEAEPLVLCRPYVCRADTTIPSSKSESAASHHNERFFSLSIRFAPKMVIKFGNHVVKEFGLV